MAEGLRNRGSVPGVPSNGGVHRPGCNRVVEVSEPDKEGALWATDHYDAAGITRVSRFRKRWKELRECDWVGGEEEHAPPHMRFDVERDSETGRKIDYDRPIVGVYFKSVRTWWESQGDFSWKDYAALAMPIR